jgi:hypothetical protein
MGKPAEAGLNAADDNGDVFINGAYALDITSKGPVGPEAGFTAGRIRVFRAPFFGGGITGNHGIKIARPNKEGQAGTAQNGVRNRIFPIGLGDDPHPEPIGLQKTADQCRRKRRMIYIGVSGHKDKITFLPAPLLQTGTGNGKKIRGGQVTLHPDHGTDPGNFLFKVVFNPHLERHLGHGAGAAGAGQFEGNKTLLVHGHKFHIPAVGLEGGAHVLQSIFNLFFKHNFLLITSIA